MKYVETETLHTIIITTETKESLWSWQLAPDPIRRRWKPEHGRIKIDKKVYDWCQTQYEDAQWNLRYTSDTIILEFPEKEDATTFKLHWAGK